MFGPLVSMNLNVPFLLIRKTGKLPGPTIKVSSTKEYGKVIICFLNFFLIEQFSIECHESKTKVITLANYKGYRQSCEQIKD